MDNIVGYAGRTFAFVSRYLRQRWQSHAIIVTAISFAVLTSVGTQYWVKLLVDSLTCGTSQKVLLAFLFLVTLIAADNLLWRAAGWIASTAFVKVTGDLRRDLFRHLTGHAPSY